MKTEFLKGLGLEQDAIDKIMAENGRDIEAQKALTTTAETNLATANTTITQLKDAVKKFDGVDVTALNNQITSLQTKYDSDIAALKLDTALDHALSAAKARNPKLAKAALDTSKIKLDGDKLLGLDDQLTALKTSDPYLFAEEQTKDPDESNQNQTGFRLNSGGTHKAQNTPDYDKMSDDEYYAAITKKKE